MLWIYPASVQASIPPCHCYVNSVAYRVTFVKFLTYFCLMSLWNIEWIIFQFLTFSFLSFKNFCPRNFRLGNLAQGHHFSVMWISGLLGSLWLSMNTWFVQEACEQGGPHSMGEWGWLGSAGHSHCPIGPLSRAVHPEHFVWWLSSTSVHSKKVKMEASRPFKDWA